MTDNTDPMDPIDKMRDEILNQPSAFAPHLSIL